MSYGKSDELDDAIGSFHTACQAQGYDCRRFEGSAFVFADLTELRPNLLYELGYAEGLRKREVVTAPEGTDAPFDVEDMPVILWQGQAAGGVWREYPADCGKAGAEIGAAVS